MEKLDTMEQITKLQKKAVEVAKELYGDIKETDFTVIQPYADGHGIMFSVSDDDQGERTMSVNVVDTLTVLPPIDGTLDAYEEETD
ncbi:hypothetical protein LP032_097 [Listeria phage LP-032]|uniref:Uncharacterized protein n=2 Tax=Homburgvirus LP26 TaxID=1921126 RepID=A0A059TAQ7_9CAUD|nr:hypothetical protein LP026_068 [Listeria phage LP-026]AHL18946.1 hypothetical protein LP032_097 [Listeria phage LP-032]AHN84762.1 hypothetical protein LP026_068 [Listeria phage LP-026]